MKPVWDQPAGEGRSRRRLWHVMPLLAATGLVYQALCVTTPIGSSRVVNVPLHAEESLAKCRSLHVTPGPPNNFSRRRVSDRFVSGTKPVLLRNAHVWTGGNNGTEVLDANILIEGGIIKAVGRVPPSVTGPYEELKVIDLKGAWVTPGIVDVHSHIGDGSAPSLEGSDDTNSLKGTTQPWLRSLDGLNTHDDSYSTSIAGGVTTANVLPGSANAIGGQAFTIKLRRTSERSPTSMLLEPPFTTNGTAWEDVGERPRWRQLKQACGENPSRVYGNTRMDTIWAFRSIYNEARKVKEAQDDYCSKATAHDWAGLGRFPESLEYEALVDVLRGRVRVHTHCYETVDFDALIRLSQEFKFPIAAVHHASEAFLVPDLLKSAYGHPPAVALFATNARYKREAYRGSEFAPRILTEHGFSVVMKSDHSVLNERDLLFEAQQAYYYGLPWNIALASVTSTSADVLGYGHRIGYIKRGYDADLVVWDSHPLALGATPKMVFIDGVSQLENAHVLHKPESFQKLPEVPNFDHDAEEAVKHEGLPPLMPKKESVSSVLFTNVVEVVRFGEDAVSTFDDRLGAVLVQDGKIVCMSADGACAQLASDADAEVVDLEGGSIQPGLTTFGAPHGVVEIDQERSTNDGYVFDTTSANMPSILNGMVTRAVDGLSFQGRDTLYAYRAGVTTAISAPRHFGLIAGLGVAFSTGAVHKLEAGAVLQQATALHVTVSLNSPISVSTQIGTLRRLLFGHGTGEVAEHFKQVAEGRLTLVVEAHSADVISSLILLKREVEAHTHRKLKMTITHASEAHLVAFELAHADIGVVLVPARPFPFTWEDRRILPGPPLTEKSQVRALHEANVTVAIGVLESWDSRNTPFYLGWTALEANGTLTKREALALGSTNVQKLLGADVKAEEQDLVATRGGDLLTMQAKVVAHVSPRQSKVMLF